MAAAVFAWQQTVNQLQFDGKTVSTNLKMVDGELYVSARDVAGYLGGQISIQNGTATIQKNTTDSQNPSENGNLPPATLGSAQPFNSLTIPMPKPAELSTTVGQDAESGGFAVKIESVQSDLKSYRTQFEGKGRTIRPALDGDRLVVVKMRLENRGEATATPPTPSSSGITLFDDKGVGMPIQAFDARRLGDPNLYVSDVMATSLDVPLLAPQGAFEFAAVFSLPKGRTPSRLLVALPPTSMSSGGANVTVKIG